MPSLKTKRQFKSLMMEKLIVINGSKNANSLQVKICLLAKRGTLFPRQLNIVSISSGLSNLRFIGLKTSMTVW